MRTTGRRPRTKSPVTHLHTRQRYLHLCFAGDGCELARFYPEAAGRVRVVHHGSEHLEAAVRPETTPTRQRFALYVGNREYYKTFPWFSMLCSDRSGRAK